MPAADDAQDSRVARSRTRVHHDPRHARARRLRLFPLFFDLRQCSAPVRRWLATFWGPSVRYGPNTTSSAHRSERRGNATGLTLRNRIPRSELMKRLFAAAVILAAIVLAAGCSSSVDNPPDVGPTDPTTGNRRSAERAATLSPNRALFSPNQGILPYPHDAYFTPTPGVPTDGTLNLPSSAFFPATLRLSRHQSPSRWSMRSTVSPRRRRSSCASRRAIDITTVGRRHPAHRSAHRSGDQGDGRLPGRLRARCAACSCRTSTTRVETAPNIDAGGTLVQIVPLRPLLANNDCARRHPPA